MLESSFAEMHLASVAATFEDLSASESSRDSTALGPVNDERGRSQGLADPLVASHFQVDGVGRWTLPALAGDATVREGKQEVLDALECASMPPQNETNAELADAETVADAESAAVGSLVWRTFDVDGRPTLAAVREVRTPGSRLRQGFLVDREELDAIALNSVKLGASASTDTHMTTPGAVNERNWTGHIFTEWNREGRLLQPSLIPSGKDGNPGGLTGVFAVENSRDAIFDALKRRETFGTSGPRITPRFFASWDNDAGLCEAPDMLDQLAGGTYFLRYVIDGTLQERLDTTPFSVPGGGTASITVAADGTVTAN